MAQPREIDIDETLQKLHNQSEIYAAAKAQRVYVEEFRKIVRAREMLRLQELGVKSVAAQERDATASVAYEQAVLAWRDATKAEEHARCVLEFLRVQVEVWRSMNADHRQLMANNRAGNNK